MYLSIVQLINDRKKISMEIGVAEKGISGSHQDSELTFRRRGGAVCYGSYVPRNGVLDRYNIIFTF